MKEEKSASLLRYLGKVKGQYFFLLVTYRFKTTLQLILKSEGFNIAQRSRTGPNKLKISLLLISILINAWTLKMFIVRK